MESRENNSSMAPLRFTHAAEAAQQSFLLAQRKTHGDALRAFERILCQTIPTTEYERGWCAAAGYAVRFAGANATSPRMLPMLMAHPDKAVVLSQLGLGATVRVNLAESTPGREFPLALVGGGSETAVRMPPKSIAASKVLAREVTLTFSDDDDGVIDPVAPRPVPEFIVKNSDPADPPDPEISHGKSLRGLEVSADAAATAGISPEKCPRMPKKKRTLRRPKRNGKSETPAKTAR